MSTIDRIDYSVLDRPEILMFLFHPRAEWGDPRTPATGRDVMIPVDEGVMVGARFHGAAESAPIILFFHGNGEIVSDYNELAPLYTNVGINFFPVDYRGYGRSTGRPTVTSMMRDCHEIFHFATRWLVEGGFSGKIIVMGRSLGSASALELAAHYKDRLGGLIIESGFAHLTPLLQLLGIDTAALTQGGQGILENLERIRGFDKPTLIIHAERDHIIPFSEGQALYEASPSPDKRFVKIPGANHNDILVRGLKPYMEAVKALVDRASIQAR